MRIAEIGIKILAVLLMIAASVCAYGRELAINAFAENKKNENAVLSKSIKRDIAPILETEDRVVQRKKNAILTSDYGELPFLVKDIKYNCLYGDGIIILYNSNQKMVYDLNKELCIEFVYNSSIGEPTLSDEECITEIRRAVYKVFSQKGISIEKVSTVSDTEKIFTAKIKTAGCFERWMIMSVRKDTGSVIYFKILGNEEVE